MESTSFASQSHEFQLEQSLRKFPWLIPAVTLLVLNAFSVLHHWCEHVGYNKERESNTFWFPLGMGIGNHDVHHHAPHLSWFTLWRGLFSRPKTTSESKAIYGVLFDPHFEHYEVK